MVKTTILVANIFFLLAAANTNAQQLQQTGFSLDDMQCAADRGPSFTQDPFVVYYSNLNSNNKKPSKGCNENNFNARKVSLPARESRASLAEQRRQIRDKILANGFEPTKPIYVLVHGFLANIATSEWMCSIKDLVLNNNNLIGGAQVLLVDWSGGNKLFNGYRGAVSNARHLGKLIARLFVALDTEIKLGEQQKKPKNSTETEIDLRQVHLIGHSLGGHVCGFAAVELSEQWPRARKVQRITALDPAGPCFGARAVEAAASTDGSRASKRRLSASAAELVVAIHSNANGFGLADSVAHVDVYVNGGSSQPGCSAAPNARRQTRHRRRSRQMNFISVAIGAAARCDHSYSHELLKREFYNAANVATKKRGDQKCHFVAWNCASWSSFRAGECGGACSTSGGLRCVHAALGWFDGSGSTGANNTSRGSGHDPLNGRADQLVQALGVRPETGGEPQDFRAATSDEKFNEIIAPKSYHSQQDNQMAIETPAYSDGPEKSLADAEWRFFARAAENGRCLFTYRLLLLISKENNNNDQTIFYIQLPLATKDSSEKQLYRLVQVSHKVKPASAAHKMIAQELRETHANLNLPSNTDFFTTLVSFEESDECKAQQTVAASNMQLCKPLPALKRARVWSSNQLALANLKYVSLEYLSDPSQSVRQVSSTLLDARGMQVLALNATPSSSLPTEEDFLIASSSTTSPSSSLSSAASSIWTPVNCFVSALLFGEPSASSSSGVRCRRPAAELSHFVDVVAR